jgi:hypothetical protein
MENCDGRRDGHGTKLSGWRIISSLSTRYHGAWSFLKLAMQLEKSSHNHHILSTHLMFLNSCRPPQKNITVISRSVATKSFANSRSMILKNAFFCRCNTADICYGGVNNRYLLCLFELGIQSPRIAARCTPSEPCCTSHGTLGCLHLVHSAVASKRRVEMGVPISTSINKQGDELVEVQPGW